MENWKKKSMFNNLLVLKIQIFLTLSTRLLKALYGLKQAPRAWYETLSQFLIENHFIRGTIDKNLFHRYFNGSSIFVQIYADEIIFGSTDEKMCSSLLNLFKVNMK